jgi:exodeoxyribonuclease VII small subunit
MKDPKSPPTFEAGITRLRALVEDLESKNLDLDESINTFEEGLKLTKSLADRLTQAEARLETLAKGEDGRLKATVQGPGYGKSDS